VNNIINFFNILGHDIPDVARSQITPGVPQQLKGSAPRVINFPEEFGGYGIDVVVDNLDAVGTLTFRINSRIGDIKTISASGAFNFNDTKIVQLQIVTGTNWEVTFNIVPLPGGR